MAACRVQKCPRKRLHMALAPLERFRPEVLHGLPRLLRGRCGRQRRTKRHAHGIRQMAWKFPKESPAGKTEDGAPYTVKIHGDDRNFYAFNDAFHAAAEGHHLADARHLAFGKNTK